MPPYSIFFLIFAAAILLYADILASSKDEKMLPLNVQASIKHRKNKKQYITGLSKCIALVSLSPAVAAIVGIWSAGGMMMAFVVGLILTLWLSTRIMKDVT